MDDAAFSRRDVLKVSAFGATALALPLTATLRAKDASDLDENRMPRPYRRPFVSPPVALPLAGPNPPVRDAAGRPVYVLQMEPTSAEIAPGIQTQMWGYRALNNPATPRATFPGPTIVAQQGQPVVVRFINRLPARHPVFRYVPTTSVHLHGHPSRPQYDGYANDTSTPGQFKDYVYENDEDARTIWYHDHAVHHTAENVYWGLAAQYHLNAPVPDGLPTGDYEKPFIISDVALDTRGQLLYDDRSDSGPMGDIILVNGVPWPVLRVEPRRYRFRMLNASIARAYRLRLSTGAPMTVVSTDGGPMPVPAPTTELRMSMGERYGVVIDFTPFAGRRVELRNVGVDNAIDYDHTDQVTAFDVGTTVTSNAGNVEPQPLPESRIPAVMRLTESPGMIRRRLEFERNGSEWTINDETWADVEDSGFRDTVATPAHDSVELWTLENGSGGWFHPIHLHLVDYKVLDRNGRPPRPYEQGPKDVVYLGENETIRILARFGPHQGRYMIHCHNNTHEDHDMMHQMRVGGEGPDPVTTAPPRPMPVTGPEASYGPTGTVVT